MTTPQIILIAIVLFYGGALVFAAYQTFKKKDDE